MSQDNDETMLDSSPKGPHKSALKAGDRLGDYVLMRMLGAGAMGQVYLGRQVHLNQTCAIKVLPEELSRSQDFTKRFASEGQALARMDNSSIVRVLNASVDAGRHFMVLEFVDGGDLSEYMHKKGGKLDEAETYDVLSQILDGLAYAHKKNIVHRDLKPANILRTSDGKFKISDFGLALVMDSGFVQDLVRKSIVADKPVDAASDATVYSGAKAVPGRGQIDPDATMVAGPSPVPAPRVPAFDPDATMVQSPAPVRPAAIDPDATVVRPAAPVRPQPMKAAFDPDATMVQGPAVQPSRPTSFDPDATMVAGPSTPAPRKPSFDPDATMVAGPSAPAGGGDETVVAGPASGKVPHAESVADAGTVHSTADISGASAFVGTLDYMSPEVRAGQAADARSDIYAIGIMAYQMLTGRKPLGRAKAVSVLRPGLSPTWDEWIDKCLEVETSERFQGAGEALEALKNVRVGSVAQDSAGSGGGTSSSSASGRTPAAGTAVNVAKNVTAAAKADAEKADALPKKRSKVPIFIAAAILVVLAGGAGIAINLMKHDGASAPGAPGADSGKAVVQTPPVADDKTGPASSIGTRTDSRPDSGPTASKPAGDSSVSSPRPDERRDAPLSQGQSPRSQDTAPGGSDTRPAEHDSRPAETHRAENVGRISIGDLPAGTMLSLDGSAPAPAASVLNGVEPGKHVLRFTREGFEPVETIVRVIRGDVAQTGPINFVRTTGALALEALPVSLEWRIVSKPSDAEPSQMRGVTPASLSRLPTGTYAIEFSAEGVKPFTRSVEVASGSVRNLSVNVPGGSLAVRSNVEGAVVTDASGRTLGKTPLAIPLTPAGDYVLSVSAEGYTTASLRGRLADGGKLELSAFLDKAAAPEEGRATGLQIAAGVVVPLEWIAPGAFRMGSENGEIGREASEMVHNVTLAKGFWMARTEVTQGQWSAVMGGNPSGFSAAGPDAPVEKVSWDEAMEYCRRLTEIARNARVLPAGYEFSLPTEAQWEYACRAGSTGAFEGDAGGIAWSAANSGRKTHSVAQKSANAFGLFDMHGNVAEWCLDWYGPYPQTDAADPVGPASGQFRVARGGSWQQGSSKCRSASRNSFVPTDRWNYLGFRVVLTKTTR